MNDINQLPKWAQDKMTMLVRERDFAIRERDKLKSFIQVQVACTECPCCNGVDSCNKECTYSDDCPEEFARMEMVRKLFGENS